MEPWSRRWQRCWRSGIGLRCVDLVVLVFLGDELDVNVEDDGRMLGVARCWLGFCHEQLSGELGNMGGGAIPGR